MELLPCIIFVKSSADPRLLGALRQTLLLGGRDVVIGMKKWMSVFHSVSNRAREKCSINSISSATLSTHFFCLEQETVGHPRYMI